MTGELRRKLYESADRFYLVDALPRRAYSFRHLPGALSLPVAELRARLAEVLPDRQAEIVVYCSGPL